jgi:hypothetical protein
MNPSRLWFHVSTLFLLAALPAVAAEVIAGPKGGRWLDATPHPAEFFVTPERKVEITFYDAASQPVAPGSQVVSVIAETPGGRRTLTLAPTTTGFVSTEALPEGEPYRVVVQIRPDSGATPQNFRVDLNLEVCGGCDHAEYACTCVGH